MKWLLVATTLGFSASLVYSSLAGSADYTINPAESVIKLSGRFVGAPLEAQAPGSDSAKYSREINAQLTDDLLTVDTSHAASLFQGMPLLPGREVGDADISYGLQANSPSLGEVLLSTTRLGFYFSTQYGPPLNVSDGAFLPNELGFFLSDGAVYYSVAGVGRQYVDLHGYGAPNRATIPGTLIRQGVHETLTIPVATTFDVTTPHGNLTLSFEGKIVASRIIPAAVLQSQTPNELFGLSVATSADTVLIGAPFGEPVKGEVYVFNRAADGSWGEHQVLKPSYGIPTTMFGTAISLSNNIAAIATYHSPVFIFERDGVSWHQTALIETPDDTSMKGDNLSLSDGTLAIGVNTFGNLEQGCVLIYERDEVSRTWRFVTRVQADAPQEQAFFGSSVALRGDYLVVGAPGVANDSGAVYAFRRENDT